MSSTTQSYHSYDVNISESNKSYLIIANIVKKSNAYDLLRLAVALNLQPIVVNLNGIVSDGDILEYNALRMLHLNEVKEFLERRNIPIVAIEICEQATKLSQFKFPEFAAFMPGNEGTGLNQRQRDITTSFVYIPQFGNGIESLNVTVATSVVLYEYYSRNNNI